MCRQQQVYCFGLCDCVPLLPTSVEDISHAFQDKGNAPFADQLFRLCFRPPPSIQYLFLCKALHSCKMHMQNHRLLSFLGEHLYNKLLILLLCKALHFCKMQTQRPRPIVVFSTYITVVGEYLYNTLQL